MVWFASSRQGDHRELKQRTFSTTDVSIPGDEWIENGVCGANDFNFSGCSGPLPNLTTETIRDSSFEQKLSTQHQIMASCLFPIGISVDEEIIDPFTVPSAILK